MRLFLQFIIVSILVAVAIFMHYPRGSAKPNYKSNIEIEEHLRAYRGIRDELAHKRKDLEEEWAVASDVGQKELIEKARTIFIHSLSKQFFPAWYGTRWAFHGTTQEPLRGSIACGYFVSTTLQHAGVQLHRVKMAQQAASVMINSLCKPSTIRNCTSMKDLESYLRGKKEGIFILGLDKHVGYAQRDGDKLWFIHSTIGQGRKVLRESLLDSKVIKRSKIKMIGELTGNDAFIRAWIEGTFCALKQ